MARPCLVSRDVSGSVVRPPSAKASDTGSPANHNSETSTQEGQAQILCFLSTQERQNQILCSLSCQNVVDGQDEASFCEGKCKQWIHCYCAGVSLPQFQSLSTSAIPFLCTLCCQAKWEGEVNKLRMTVDALSHDSSQRPNY